jgi:20S proteasome subunit beta 4
MAIAGETCDRERFASYIQRNLDWYKYKYGYELDLESTAEFTRSELATAIRKGPFQCNLLIGGYDQTKEKARLFWLDYMGTLVEVKKGGHGYAGYFTSSVLDNANKKDMTLEEGMEAIKDCIKEMQTRFLMSQPKFVIKIVTKDGTKVETIG